MLVYFWPAKIGEVQHFAGVKHGFRKECRFRARNSAAHRGHEPGGKLIIGDASVGCAGDEKRNLFAAEFPAVAFFADQINGAHEAGRATSRQSRRRELWKSARAVQARNEEFPEGIRSESAEQP